MTTALWFESCAGRPWPMLHPPHPWTSQDISRRVGASIAAVNTWRQGRERPSQERLEAVLLALAPDWTIEQRDAILLAYGYVPTWMLSASRDGSGFAESFLADAGRTLARYFHRPGEGRSSVLHSALAGHSRTAGLPRPPVTPEPGAPSPEPVALDVLALLGVDAQ